MKFALLIFTLLVGHMLFTELHAAEVKDKTVKVSNKSTKKVKFKKVARKSKISKRRNPNAPNILVLTSDETHAQIFQFPEDGKTYLEKRF